MTTTTKRSSRVEWLPRIVVLVTVAALVAIIIHERTKKPPPDVAAAIEARLDLAAGEVLVDQGEGDSRALSGTALRTGAKIRTSDAARALVRLPDGASAFLRGATALELAADSVKLDKGEYWLDAPLAERQALAHRVGDVGVTAVDAGLSIKRGDGVVEVYVARGMAVVTSPGGRVEVSAGQLATAKGREAPAVEGVSFWEDWTGGMADYGGGVATIAAGNGEIYAVDRGGAAGAQADRLQIKSQSVRAVIRSGLAETEVDQTFLNPSQRDVEGWYWFAVPEGASVTGFAVETNGVLVEGELTERKEAAAKYTEAKASGHAPAILEWIDSRTYRARIFPIASSGTRRVVLRYIELLPLASGKLAYVYPMAGRSPIRIGELSLRVDLGDEGKKMDIATLADARVEDGGKAVTMRRSGYTPRVDFQLEAKVLQDKPHVTLSRFEGQDDSADYVMARYTPDVEWDSATKLAADVVVVVDTSAGGDEASRLLKTGAAEAILRTLSGDDRFALVALDARPVLIHPAKGLANASSEEIGKALEALAGHEPGGATDLSALFATALELVHGSTQPAVVYVGDGIATSGAMTGEQLIERLRRALTTSPARLFTVAVGPEADGSLLGELARAGGGASFHIEDARSATARALELTAAVKVPTLTDFEIDLGAGLDEPFLNVSGKVSKGAQVVLLARTHHDLPKKVMVRGRLGSEKVEREVEVKSDASVVGAFVPRLWAAEYVRRLLGAAAGPEAERGRIAELGIDYGLMTPFTSILALENEAAYSRMGIKRRRSPLRGVRLGALDARSERRLAAALHAGDARASAFGCVPVPPLGGSSKDEDAEQEPSRLESDNKEGGTGTRAKGDEGSMGDPNNQLTERRYGVAGPADEPIDGLGWGRDDSSTVDPHIARQAQVRESAEFGMIGLLNAGAGGEGRGAGLGGLADAEKKKLASKARPSSDVALGTCSAEARRPLAQRTLVWRQRLKTAKDAPELIARYLAAMRACELGDWHAERIFLELMQQRIDSEGAATAVLAAFSHRSDVQRHLAKLILRRAVDERIVAAVEAALFGSAVDWAAVDREISAIEDVEKRIEEIRLAMAKAPDDPNGLIRLASLLAEAGKSDEALAIGRRLRERGLLTLRVVRQLGDVLARQDLTEEAVRTYSEIVEFDPESTGSRRLLGDIYLSRGWYEPAYLQYKTTVEQSPDDALGWLRLANAAAGAGRVDEALRLDRRVASAQGRPGPDDPRKWARLWSAVRLAHLLHAPPAGADVGAIQRKLKELGIFPGEGTLVVVTWDDLTSDVALVASEGERATLVGEPTDAAAVGLAANLVSEADLGRVSLAARLRSLPRGEALGLTRHDLSWNGKSFSVAIKKVELAARKTVAAL